MPTLYRTRPHPVPGAATVPKLCTACGNLGEWGLHYTKEGVGIGVPTVSMFTDKAVLAKKTYYVLCPVCSDADKITRDAAEGLIAKVWTYGGDHRRRCSGYTAGGATTMAPSTTSTPTTAVLTAVRFAGSGYICEDGPESERLCENDSGSVTYCKGLLESNRDKPTRGRLEGLPDRDSASRN